MANNEVEVLLEGVNFKSENGFRVWIACRYNQSNPEFKFDIKVTTDKHPFGFDSKFKNLFVSQRIKAFKTSLSRKYLLEKEITEDKPLEDILELIKEKGLQKDVHISLEDTKPYSPKTKYVAIDELFKAIQKTSDKSAFEAVKNVFQFDNNSDELNEAFLQELVDALGLLLEHRNFYAIEVESHSYKSAHNNKDIDIEVLFKRVGTGGTNLSDLDFAYSLIKQRLDGAKSYMGSLLKKNDVSSLFSSLDCVDLVIRTSCFEAFLNAGLNPSDTKIITDKNDHKKISKKLYIKALMQMKKSYNVCLILQS